MCDVEVVQGTQQTGCTQGTDIHLYVLQVGSALLNHLQSSWRTRLLVSFTLGIKHIELCYAVRMFITVNTKVLRQ